jgi:UDP-N-acetyl-D-mannosaminuronate dehydrogenase
VLARLLAGHGAEVVVHDPFVRQADWERVLGDGVTGVLLTGDLWPALQDADALALVTRHAAYQKLDLQRAARLMRTCVLVDGRNIFDPAAAAAAGFIVRAVGKGTYEPTGGRQLSSELDRLASMQIRDA